jgi:hypothetical protein
MINYKRRTGSASLTKCYQKDQWCSDRLNLYLYALLSISVACNLSISFFRHL